MNKELLEYFKGDELAASVWLSKYAKEGEVTPADMHRRMAKEFARVEKIHIEKEQDILTKENLSYYGQQRKDLTEDKIFNLFDKFKTIIPQGSVMANLGSKEITSLSNCFVIGTPEDSYGGILRKDEELVQLMKRRGGVGGDLSTLRPATTPVTNSAKTSTGAVSFAHRFSNSTREVAQGGRRGALMLSMDIKHPDSMDFIKSKRDRTSITGANISVKLGDDFMKAVEADDDYLLRFPTDFNPIGKEWNEILEYDQLQVFSNLGNKIYAKKVKAKEYWDEIITSAKDFAEPGLMFWDRMVNYSPDGVYPEFRPITTNPCQPKWAPILSKEGLTTMGEIKVGDIIWSEEGWTKVIRKQSSGIKPVYEYRTTAGSFIGTDTHRVVSKRKKVEAKDAKTLDLLQGNLNEEIIIDDHDVMAGLMIGDGTIHKASNDLRLLCIGKDDQDYFTSSINNLILKHRPGINEYMYEINTDISIEELPRTWNRKVPDRYKFANQNKILGFLRGLYSANGSVVDKRVTLKTSSPIIRDDVQIMLSAVGIRSYYTTNKPTETEHHNGTYTSKESYDINISTDREIFYNNIGFIQQYKMDKLKNTFGKVSTRLKSHDIIDTILLGEEEVFNITVDNNNHTYWTGGLNVSNCSEIAMQPYDACRLIAVNTFGFVNHPFTPNAWFDYETFYEIVYEAMRLSDDLVDLEIEAIGKILDKIDSDPESEDVKRVEKELWIKIRDTAEASRRTGLGVTGIGDTLAALNIKYDSLKGQNTKDAIMSQKMLAELDCTIDLSILRGSFPGYNNDLEFKVNNSNIKGNNDWYDFLLTDYPTQAHRMIQYGRRNLSFSTIAPTGSVSLLAQVTSGLEPLFQPYYIRRKKINSTEDRVDFIDELGDKWTEYGILHPKFKDWAKINFFLTSEELEKFSKTDLEDLFKQSPWYGSTANDIDWIKRVESQAILQKYITHSISSTINLPSTVTHKEVSDIYLESWKKGLKGVTVYVDGSRSGVLVTENNQPKDAPLYRPKEIPCKVLRFKNERKNWIAFIGLIDDKPYEIFTGINDLDEFPVPTHVKEGTIIKIIQEGEKSRYDFQYIDKYGYTNTLGGLNRVFSKEYWNYARFTSTLLRKNIPLLDVIDVINKLEFSNKSLNSWQAGMIRSLSSFVKDGTKAKDVCEECGDENVIYENGCKTCKACGHSACG